MGKRRTDMKVIENHKARKIVFAKRRNSLLKKAKELSILCDIKVLIIIYDQDKQEVEIWPSIDHYGAERIIESFEQKKVSEKPWEFPSASNKARFGAGFSVSDRKNMIDRYTDQNELQNLVSELDAKIAAVVNEIRSRQVLAEQKMLCDSQETELLNKGKGKEVVIGQDEPVNTQQYQSVQTFPRYPNQNFISYPQFHPYTSKIPFVPLPIHYVDPSSMQPPNMNAIIPSFHYIDPSSMQPPNMNDISSLHYADPASSMQPPNMNDTPSFHYVDPAFMQQPYYDPNIYRIQPLVYYPMIPGFALR